MDEKFFEEYRRYKERLWVSQLPDRIILVRHGQSEANVDENVYRTTPDNQIHLTPLGREQARAAGRKVYEQIKDESVMFFVSPFTRSRETLDGILDCGEKFNVVGIREDPRLREQERGNLQLYDKRQVDSVRWKVGRFFYRYLEGESGADVYDRITAFMETMFRTFKRKPGVQNVVIVAHGFSLRIFLMRYFKWIVDVFDDLDDLTNAEPVVLRRPLKSHKFFLTTELRSYEGLWKQASQAFDPNMVDECFLSEDEEGDSSMERSLSSSQSLHESQRLSSSPVPLSLQPNISARSCEISATLNEQQGITLKHNPGKTGK